MIIKRLFAKYEQSKLSAEDLNEKLFYGTKNYLYVREMVIFIVVTIATIAFIFIYKTRKLVFALLTALVLFAVVVFMLNTLATAFNYWTVFIDLCQQTMAIFDPTKLKLDQRFDKRFESFFTCLMPSDKQILANQ